MKLRLPFAILALALAPLAAPLLAASHPLAALFIRSFFSQLCHQNPARSFVIDGSPAAVCVRCLGIYWGVALGMVTRLGKGFALRIFSVAMMLNVLDVATGMSHWHGNMPVTRFLFGLLLGVATSSVLFLPKSIREFTPATDMGHPAFVVGRKRKTNPTGRPPGPR